jgi:hypothetical protein
MEGVMGMAAAGVGGLVVGFVLAKMMSGGGAKAATSGSEVAWWQVRETLTGTQLQILQYMEEHKSVSITKLQEKFSFIPDRELYYRLEQIVLMKFIQRGRDGNDVVYVLNEDYSATIEGDKTVMLPGD